MTKKGELQFSPLVYAILALIILVVCIGIFIFLTQGGFEGIFEFLHLTEEQGGSARNNLAVVLGNRCDTAEDMCVNGKNYVCENNKWTETEDEC